jgi:GAF domain-containing protein
MKGISSPPRLIQEALTVSQNALRASGLFLREMQKLAPCQMAAIYFLDESADEITTVLFGTDLSLPEEVGQIFPLARSWIEQCLHPGIPYIESAKGMQGPASADLRYRDSGIKSSFWVPLANQGRLGE